MMLVPVGYLGFKYWDKHHRGRRGRERECAGKAAVEQPPSFREFLQEEFFHQDDNEALKDGNPHVATAILQELNELFEPTTTPKAIAAENRLKEEDKTMTLSRTYSFDTSDNDEEQQSDSELDDELVNGLEYESEQQAKIEENEKRRVYGKLSNSPSPTSRKRTTTRQNRAATAVSWTPSRGLRIV